MAKTELPDVIYLDIDNINYKSEISNASSLVADIEEPINEIYVL